MHAQMMAAWNTPAQLAMERNRPYLMLTNTSTVANGGDGNASLTSFSMTIGDTTQNFDWARLVSLSPGVTATLVTPDTLDNNIHSQVVTYNFTGLMPGKEVIFQIDIDPNMATASPFTDYRQVLFKLNGGANPAGNSATSATFNDPTLPVGQQDISVGPTLWENPVDPKPTVFGMEFVTRYMADHVTSFATGNISSVPEPSSIALAGIATVGLIAGWRRSKSHRRDV
jgi:PEP-CTERM motif